MASTNAKTAGELLVYIHNQLKEILTVREATHGRRWLPEAMRADLFGQTLHYKLVELKRTGYAVPETWWAWLPRPEGFFLVLDNPHEVARLEMEVESAVKALRVPAPIPDDKTLTERRTRWMSLREVAEALGNDERTCKGRLGSALRQEAKQWWTVDLRAAGPADASAIEKYLAENPTRKRRQAQQKAAQSGTKRIIPST